jgi:hypothetical protein
MSVKAAQDYIKAKFSKSESALAKAFFADYRENLDIKVQFLDISLTTFEVNNSLTANPENLATLKDYHKYFIDYIKYLIGNDRIFIDTYDTRLKDLLTKEKPNRDSISACILVLNNGEPYLIGYSYHKVRDVIYAVSRSSLRHSSLGAKLLPFKPEDVDPESGEIISAVKLQFKSTLQLGHQATGVGAETSQLAEKILAVSNISGISVGLRTSLAARLQKLYTVQANLGYTFHNTSSEEKQERTNLVGQGYINLIIQPEEVNRKFSSSEIKIYNQFLLDVAKELDPEYIPGSNTIVDDAKQNVIDRVLSALHGKKIKTVKPHAKVEGKIVLPTVKPKVSVEIPKIPAPKTPIRTTKGQFTSLVSIQNLLNQGLASQIQKNMGSGSRRDILNYQTGRFAESAKVETMSQSREGMITAFYSYMRNPYATFSFGGQQSIPASRDPKLLISRSIREIGATMVANRMRAVLV